MLGRAAAVPGAKGRAQGPSIVISYRRGDANADAGRLFDHLAGVFGPERIFMDIDTLKGGEDFVDTIERAVAASDAIVAVIGQRWRDRLDDPRDFVRFEIATALRLHKRVIPVLVADAKMPSPDVLPPDVSALARLHAITVSHFHFHADAERLVATLRHQLPPGSQGSDVDPHPPSRFRDVRTLAGLAAIVGLGAFGLWSWQAGIRLPSVDWRSAGSEQMPSPPQEASGPPIALIPYADLDGVDMRSMMLMDSDLHGAHLKGANFTEAYLDRSSLVGADLRLASLSKAWLREVDFSKADLKGADLQGADLRGAKLVDADLDGADLRSTLNLTCDQLRRAKSWTRAVLDPAMHCQTGAGPEAVR